MTVARGAAIAVVAALTIGGCTHGPQPTPSTRPSAAESAQPAQPAQELSAANPTARFSVDGPVAARIVRIVVVANANPARQPVLLSLKVNGIGSGGAAPFPPDEPGAFTTALTPAATNALGKGQAVLEITLAPIAAGQALRTDVKLRVQAYPQS